MSFPRKLRFVAPSHPDLLAAVLEVIDTGARRVLAYPLDDITWRIVQEARAARPEADIRDPRDAAMLPTDLSQDGSEGGDAVLLNLRDGATLSHAMMGLLDHRGVTVIAPITDWFYRNRPLFVISIPKAGTHLLYKLVNAFGYLHGGVLGDRTQAGAWYCVEYSNSHTAAPDFFVDTVRRSPFGNRHHPFMSSPAVFIYRNPLDIVVSEANYYHRDGKTAFAGYLADLDFADRLLRLVDDPWLLGSIRERMARFIAWLDFPNVIPVSFEELIGSKGGGDQRVQEDVTWSLQLKLQVPGDPADLAGRIFSRDSATFFEGKIGGYRDAFTDEAYQKFQELDQDFMIALGYDGSTLEETVSPPRRADAFRYRRLRMSDADFDDTPVAVEHNYLGCSIIRYQGRFYAVPVSLQEPDLSHLSTEQLELLPQGDTVADLKEVVSHGQKHLTRRRLALLSKLPRQLDALGKPEDGALDSLPGGGVPARSNSGPRIVEEHAGFNVLDLGGRIYGVRQELGPIDFSLSETQLFARYSETDFLADDSIRSVRARIDALNTLTRKADWARGRILRKIKGGA